MTAVGTLDRSFMTESVHDSGGIADLADLVMEHLMTMDLEDPYVGLDLEQGTVTIEAALTIASDADRLAALNEAFDVLTASIRTALHAARFPTPGWETFALSTRREAGTLAGADTPA
jgi:hypothetical protein